MHEYRGSLNTLCGYLALLERDASAWTNDQRASLGGAVRAAEAMTQMATELSELHRWLELAERRATLPHAPTEFGDVLRGLAAPDPPSCAVRLIAPASPLPWHGDPVAVRDVLHLSLARLVRQRPDTREVSVSAECETDGQARVVLQPTASASALLTRAPFDLSRGSFGLSLPRIAVIVAAHRGEVVDLHADGRLIGMELRFPLA